MHCPYGLAGSSPAPGIVITDVPGIRVGHCTNASARTGCTVVLPPPGAVASGEIRGGAPAERDFALLEPSRSVHRVDAVMLSGGSVFGLAAVDGALRWLADNHVGLETPAGPVPIVVGLSLFDLLVAEPGVHPTADDGYAACAAAASDPPETGRVGAGAGATVGGWRGPGQARRAGLGSASERHGDLVVGALVAVNAYGEPLRPHGERPGPDQLQAQPFTGNTTLAVVATNGRLDKNACFLTAQSAHDGFARALEPAHTAQDGDAAVVVATGETDAPLDAVRMLAARAVEAAIAPFGGGDP
jgi:L-aminopeptidase/D-esterase-like protein